jgi:isopentenyl diphosphate isomerase/L-lactate dehydrogenase-like FMN-dependent dehydrogenase
MRVAMTLTGARTIADIGPDILVAGSGEAPTGAVYPASR